MTVFRVQIKISAKGVGLMKDRNYLVARLNHRKDPTFKGLMRNLVHADRQARVDPYKESKQTVNI